MENEIYNALCARLGITRDLEALDREIIEELEKTEPGSSKEYIEFINSIEQSS